MITILAKTKPEITLIDHTKDALDWLEKALVWKKDYIKRTCSKYGLDELKVKQRLFLTVAFHDSAKATVPFQNKLRGLPYGDESHALFSSALLYHIIQDEPLLSFNGKDFFPEILAIATHHFKLRKNVFEKFEGKTPQYYADFYPHFFEIINQRGRLFFKSDWEEIEFSTESVNTMPYEIFIDSFNDGKDFANRTATNSKFTEAARDIFILFKSILHYADWIASASATRDMSKYAYGVNETYETFGETFKAILLKEKINFKEWSSFQEEMYRSQGDIFVKIPTGQGKTEGSLLWAINGENRKILYLLPTQVTTNKMYRRLKNLFPNVEVGISHGNAQFFLKESEEIESEKVRQNYLYYRTFFNPVTVATVDQLIYSFFNWGHWVMTNSVAYNAKIVIDEIHIYDGYTLGLILEMIERCRKFNTEFALMSASLPTILQGYLKQALGKTDIPIIEDKVYDELQRHTLKTDEREISQLAQNIIVDFRKKKKVLVVCNTKATARHVFDAVEKEIGNENTMLYHSQFILKDRQKKEEDLEKIGKTENIQPYVAVCTQVCEVSLDIDFDVMYSENAPIDALIQRLGRVNRKNKKQKEDSIVTICKASEASRKYIYQAVVKILDETWEQLEDNIKRLKGNLQEKDYREIIEKVYRLENLQGKFLEDLTEGRQLFKKIWKHVTQEICTLDADEAKLNEVSSRLKDYVQVECLLKIHDNQENFKAQIENKNFDFLKRYTLKIPLWVSKKKEFFAGSLEIGDYKIPILNLKYDNIWGVTYKDDIDFQFP